MPFKFKLSKRLALMKASLAAAGLLTLACTSDLTDPQPPRNPLTQVITSADLTPLPVASVLASGDDGNIPQNTLDNDLATRWSASGDGQWIRYDLGAVMAVGLVTIAWYRGTEWASAFDIEVSLDSLTWTRAFTGRSSGQTLQPERYDFPAVPGRYVRIVGHGQWSGTTQLSLWNSITETAIYGSAAATIKPVPVASVVASGDDGNIPQNTPDNNLATRWSASGDGQWIRYDLGAVMAVGPVTIAWYRGTEWASAFDIEVSLDSLTWTRAFTGRSSGQTLQPERYDFPAVPGRYVRIVGTASGAARPSSASGTASPKPRSTEAPRRRSLPCRWRRPSRVGTTATSRRKRSTTTSPPAGRPPATTSGSATTSARSWPSVP